MGGAVSVANTGNVDDDDDDVGDDEKKNLLTFFFYYTIYVLPYNIFAFRFTYKLVFALYVRNTTFTF